MGCLMRWATRPVADPRAAGGGALDVGGISRGHAGRPYGRVDALAGTQGAGLVERPAGRQPPGLPPRARGAAAAAGPPRLVLGAILSAYQRAAEARARELDVTAEPEIVVAKTVRVNAPLAVAFEVFVGQQWWPVADPSPRRAAWARGRAGAVRGGRWYERAADGTQTDWGPSSPGSRRPAAADLAGSPAGSMSKTRTAARRSRSPSP